MLNKLKRLPVYLKNVFLLAVLWPVAAVLRRTNKNYEFYAGKYVEQPLQNNGVSVLSEGNYDYLESVQVLDDSVSEMLDYLLSKRASYPYFRSVETGYTYNDLYQIYNYLYNYEIPSLYASILTNAETKDVDLLTSRLVKDCEDVQLFIENTQERADALKKLIDTYSERNKEIMDYHYHGSLLHSEISYGNKAIRCFPALCRPRVKYDGERV